MNPGDVVLLPLAQVGGAPKTRPALVLAPLPGPYQTLLVCGISTRLQRIRPNWDEAIRKVDSDFAASGLHQESIIRLSYIRSAMPTDIISVIEQIDPARVLRLRQRLSDHLRP